MRAAGSPWTEEGVGSQGRGDAGAGATSRGVSVHNTDPSGILSAHACVCICMCLCVCLCVRVCACVDIRGQVTVIAGKPSFKFQLHICKGPGGKGGVVSRCTAPWRWFG